MEQLLVDYLYRRPHCAGSPHIYQQHLNFSPFQLTCWAHRSEFLWFLLCEQFIQNDQSSVTSESMMQSHNGHRNLLCIKKAFSKPDTYSMNSLSRLCSFAYYKLFYSFDHQSRMHIAFGSSSHNSFRPCSQQAIFFFTAMTTKVRRMLWCFWDVYAQGYTGSVN